MADLLISDLVIEIGFIGGKLPRPKSAKISSHIRGFMFYLLMCSQSHICARLFSQIYICAFMCTCLCSQTCMNVFYVCLTVLPNLYARFYVCSFVLPTLCFRFYVCLSAHIYIGSSPHLIVGPFTDSSELS